MKEHEDWIREGKTYASRRYNNKTDLLIRKWFYNLLRKSNIKSVLDIGCGVGQDAPHITASRVTYLGLDANPDNVETARQLYPKTDFTHGYIQQIDAADNSFDCIWMMSVWEIIPKSTMQQAIEECCRVARRIIINVDAGNPPHQLRERWNYIPSDWKPTLNRLYDEERNMYYTVWVINKT